MPSSRSDKLRFATFPSQLEERFVDEARFVRTWLGNPKMTGAVSPSSRALARAMARCLDPKSTGPIVELGPGTGPVTQALIERGIAPERLVLVEYESAFCELLAKRFPRCQIVEGDAYNLRDTLRGVIDQPAASIVSSLPLLTRPEEQRLSFLAQCFDVMAADGVVVQFTYGRTSPVPSEAAGARPLPFQAEGSAPIWLNIPPARVFTYRPCEADAASITSLDISLIDRLRVGTEKLRDEWRERTDRIETELRCRTRQMRLTLAEVRADGKKAVAPPQALASMTSGAVITDRLIVALDVPDIAEAERLVGVLGIGFYKIGLELAYAGGLDLAERLIASGHKVFLDLKLHDIPNTVERATRQIAKIGATFLTVHAYPQTMKAAVAAVADAPLVLLGVTVMTSLDDADLRDAGFAADVEATVEQRARQADAAGLGGLVLAASEARAIRPLVRRDMCLVTPGIRPGGTELADQKRAVTPREAIAAGADYLVVGRPITRAADPARAAAVIRDEIAGLTPTGLVP